MITIDLIKSRLATLGYIPKEADDWLISYIMDMTIKSLQIQLNVLEIPADADAIVIDKIAGEFLLNMKNTGKDIGIDLAGAVSAISEGDTSVQFDTTNTPGANVDKMIRWLISGRDDVLMAYRSIRW